MKCELKEIIEAFSLTAQLYEIVRSDETFKYDDIYVDVLCDMLAKLEQNLKDKLPRAGKR